MTRGRGKRADEPIETEAEGRAPPRLLGFEPLREPGAASFSPAAVTGVSASLSPGLAGADPTALAAAAERVLRSLRVGTDASGRSIVQLHVATGTLAGCRVDLRRVPAGVTVEVRGEDGAPDAREQAIVEALRARGIEVV